MKGALLLDVVVGEGPSILQLLPGEDQSLLVRGNAFLVLDLGLDILNGIGWLNLQGDGLASESLDEDLHTTTEPEDEMEGALLLNVVVREGPSILQLLPGEDQSLLVRRNAFLVLDLGLDVLDRVARFNLQGDGLAGESLHEDLHTTAEPEDKMEGALLLNVVVRESSAVLQLLPGEDQSLLVRGNAFLVLDLCFDVFNGVARLHLRGDGLASQSLHEDLHTTTEPEDKMESALLLNVVVREG